MRAASPVAGNFVHVVDAEILQVSFHLAHVSTPVSGKVEIVIEMGFSDMSRSVSAGLQMMQIGVGAAGELTGVRKKPVVVGIESCNQRRSRGHTYWRRRIGLRESSAFSSERIDVWCLYHRMTRTSEGVRSVLIGANDDDVG